MQPSIIEHNFRPTDNFLKQFSSEISLQEEKFDDIDHIKLLFIDFPKPKIISSLIVYLENDKTERANIHELLALKEGLTYHDCLIISTLYFSLSKDELIQLIHTSNPSKYYCNGAQLFRNANGYLIFAHQFEFLIKMILNASDDEAVKSRRAFNKGLGKSMSENHDPKKVNFLTKILNDCMVTPNVYRAFFNGANAFREYLKSIETISSHQSFFTVEFNP